MGTLQEIDPTRDLWGTQPSSDAAASSYAEYIRQQEDEEAYAHQIGDDVRYGICPACLRVLQMKHVNCCISEADLATPCEDSMCP